MKHDLRRWNAIHMSLRRRVNCVKMNVVARFLTHFSVFHFFLPQSVLRPELSFWQVRATRIIPVKLYQTTESMASFHLLNFAPGCIAFQSNRNATQPTRSSFDIVTSKGYSAFAWFSLLATNVIYFTWLPTIKHAIKCSINSLLLG